jgi:quinol monooxygenase YgiN
MSVLVIFKVRGDTDKFRHAVVDRADEFAKIADGARAEGAIHHRFGVGDGFVVVVDEWETTEHFEKFFANPDLQAFIGSVGGDLSVAPDITISEAIESADQF